MPKTLDAVIATAREIADGPVSAQADRVDAEARWPAESLAALAEAGLFGLVVPESAGGLGHGLTAVARCCEILGRQCASTGLCFGMHCVGSAVIAAKATPHQVDRYLEPIARGQHLTTLALSEPGSGSHFYLPDTTLETTSNGLRINGEKAFVTNGGHADSYVISTVAARPDEASAGEFSCVLVDGGDEGLEWQGPWNGLGMRGNASRGLRLDNVVVPPDRLLGEEGDQIWYVFEVVAPYFLVAMAGTYLGIASAALDDAIAHLRNRAYTFSGATLAEQAVLQHRLGQLWSSRESARQLVLHAARLGDTDPASALVAILSAKAEVADRATTIVNDSLTLIGGRGYSRDGAASRRLRDVRAAHVMAPTTDILRTWAGRALLNLPLLTR